MEKVFNKLGKRPNTFKGKKKFDKGSRRYELHKRAKATLGSGDLREAVKLPPGEVFEDWLAVNVVDFFNQINLLYGSISEYCREETCPKMSAGNKFEYLWADGQHIKKPVSCSAPEYVDYLVAWIQGLFDDESIFPSQVENPFPKSFVSTIKLIMRKLFRVFAHIYYSHFDVILQLNEEAHLNTSFKHYYFFITEFDLVDKREFAPLSDLIESLGLDN